jgi:hypothetical protein
MYKFHHGITNTRNNLEAAKFKKLKLFSCIMSTFSKYDTTYGYFKIQRNHQNSILPFHIIIETSVNRIS